MTTLGKILIFLNLVFALLMGILIVQVYATRTGWRAKYDIAVGNLTVSEANVKTYRAEIDDIRKRKDEEIKKVQDDLVKEKAQTDRQKQLLAEADKQLQTERANHQAQRDNAGVSNAELDRRQAETRALTAELNKAQAANAELQKQGKVLQDEKMQAVINYNSEHERNVRLLETFRQTSQKLELAEKKLATLGTGISNVQLNRNPPPEDVEGIILDTDAKTGLVTISIGSDAGISPGNTLEVFRIKPEPKYLGTIRILDSQPHQAVGRLTATPRYGALEKGDIVASKIMSTKR
jgi:Skp family chaperone for outer membrane proteins